MKPEVARVHLGEKFDTIIEALQSGYILVDREGYIRDTNPAYLKLIGFSRKKLLGKNLDEIRHGVPDDYQQTFFDRVCEEKSTDFEIQHITADGTRVDLWGSATAIDIGGKILVAEFIRDVTKKKEEERKFDAIFNSMFQFIGLMDTEGILLEANETALEFGGLKEEDVIGKPFWEARWWRIDENTQQRLKKAIKKAARGNFVRYEVEVLGKDDKVQTVDFSIKPVMDQEGEVEVLIPEGRVITEKKEIEDRLKQSEQQLNSLFEHNPLPVYLFNPEGEFIRINEKLAEFAGFGRDEMLGMSYESFIHEDDLEKSRAQFQKALEGRASQYEARVVLRDGIERLVHITKFPMYENGEIKGVYGILQDITEEREARRKLKESEQRWQRLVENNPQCVIIVVDGVVEYINKAGVEMMGAETSDEIVGQPASDFIPPEFQEQLKERLQKLGRNESVSPVEYELTTMSGDKRLVQANSVAITYRGQHAIQSVLQDITEQRQKERELEESRQGFKSLFEHNPSAVYSFDLEGNFQMANRALEELTGYTTDELIELDFAPLVAPEDREFVQEQFARAARGEAQSYQAAGVHKNGKKIYVDVVNMPIYVNDEIVGVFGIARDITQRKKAVKALEETEERWRRLVLNNPLPIIVTVDATIRFANNSAADLYGADSAGELIGKNIFDSVPPESYEEVKKRQKLIDQKKPLSISEQYFVRLDGEKRAVEVQSIPIKYKGEDAVQTVFRDISESKKREQKIKDSLKEKEVMLQEIHHRVKNNLAVVSGLLHLQVFNCDSEEVKEMFRESQMRINSMAAIHEKLYRSESLSAIDFGEYTKELVGTIISTFDFSDKNIGIAYDLDEIALNVNQAIPCGLILNELVTNCFKHAFTQRDKGKIEVSFKDKDEVLTLTVRDSGQGLPDDFDAKSKQSLGMTLVKTLARQLDGEYSVTKNGEWGGACVSVKFEKG